MSLACSRLIKIRVRPSPFHERDLTRCKKSSKVPMRVWGLARSACHRVEQRSYVRTLKGDAKIDIRLATKSGDCRFQSPQCATICTGLFLLQHYRTVSPLPLRLQTPLWRTPQPSSPKSNNGSFGKTRVIVPTRPKFHKVTMGTRFWDRRVAHGAPPN